jgi:hypothetical protein
MSRNQFYRSLVAVAATAAFWLVPSLVSQATEMRPIVVVGIPANSVALKCPTPEYPSEAQSVMTRVMTPEEKPSTYSPRYSPRKASSAI